jgi:hypothetical protein
MLHEKTVIKIAVTAFILLALLLLVDFNRDKIWLAFDSSPDRSITLFIGYVIGITIFICMYSVLSILTSRIGIDLFSMWSDDMFSSAYHAYKYIVTKEAREKWKCKLRIRGLIDSD